MSNTANHHKNVTVNVQNIAGDSFPFLITNVDTVGGLKRRIKDENVVECEPEFQKLMMMPEEQKSNAPTHTILDDDSKTLLSYYGVTAETTLHVICNMKYLTPEKEFDTRRIGRMAISPDNQKIYIVSDSTVNILNTSNS